MAGSSLRVDRALAAAEAADGQGRHGGFGAAADHHVGIAVVDGAGAEADGVKAGGAGGDHGQVRALHAEHDGQVARDHVDDGAGDEERRNLARAALQEGAMGVFDHRQTADAGTDVHADAFGILRRHFQTRVLDGLDARRHAVMDESIHAARFFGGQILGDIEPLDLPGHLRGEAGGVEAGDVGDAGFAGEDVGPSLADTDADGRNDAQAGDNYFASGQNDSVISMRNGLKRYY